MLPKEIQQQLDNSENEILALRRQQDEKLTRNQKNWLQALEQLRALFEEKIDTQHGNGQREIDTINGEINEQIHKFSSHLVYSVESSVKDINRAIDIGAYLNTHQEKQEIQPSIMTPEPTPLHLSASIEVKPNPQVKVTEEEVSSVDLGQPKVEMQVKDKVEIVETDIKEKEEKIEIQQDYSKLTAQDAIGLIQKQSPEDLKVIVLAAAEQALKNFESTMYKYTIGQLPGSEYQARVDKANEVIQNLKSDNITASEAFEALGKNGEHWNQKGWVHYNSYNLDFVNLTLQNITQTKQDFGPIAHATFETMHPQAKVESTPEALFQKEKEKQIENTATSSLEQ
ncbi:hypothetical protein L3V83_13015 [Thiotrichales bacterium 19X7-9]|nr:hypothetical protein [Thiotrichales bacterium 19X7-9]